jgi:nucleotidyltransferase substrate binding protein (TIGR01987 family)
MQQDIRWKQRNVVKEAFAARILSDGQVWIDMLDLRNLLSHTYDEATFDAAVLAIRDRFRRKCRRIADRA